MIRLVVLASCLGAWLTGAAQELPNNGRCQNLPDGAHARLTALDRGYTAEAAQAALSELGRRVSATPAARPHNQPSNHQLVRSVEGWLLKKAWLDARARREHDADESGEYCAFLLRAAAR